MADHGERHDWGNQAVGAQRADLRVTGREDGPQRNLASGSPATSDNDKLFTVAQIVALTGYSEESIRRWIRKGALAVERVGPYRRVRVRFSILRQLFPP
jgi:hypothetical protein